MAKLMCPECGEPMHPGMGCMETVVGYLPNKEGHTHNDNCLSKQYRCPNGHCKEVYLRRTCPTPGCDWRGKSTCFCHPGSKVDEWPS